MGPCILALTLPTCGRFPLPQGEGLLPFALREKGAGVEGYSL